MRLMWTLAIFATFATLVCGKPGDPYTFETNELPKNSDGSVYTKLMASVGNGHLATTVLSDSIFINGLYNGKLGESHRARIASLFSADYTIEGCHPDELKKTYRLETKRAMFIETVYCGIGKAGMSVITYAHNELDRLLMTEMHVWEPSGNPVKVNIESMAGMESDDFDWNPVYNNSYFYKSGCIKEPELHLNDRPCVHIYYNAILPTSFELSAMEYSRSYFFLMSVDVDKKKAFDTFLHAMDLLNMDGVGEILAEGHVHNWDQIWMNGNILLEMNQQGQDDAEELQEAIIGGLYYLYSSLPSATASMDDSFYGLSPGGLANGKKGQDYQGHVFWDMETWMFPAILPFRPDLAKRMLNYRVRNMPQAMERAQEGGYQGARYPWESAYTGTEVTPDLCVLCRENQQHITGDIAFALRSFMAFTGDLDWLSNGDDNLEFALNMARFWESRPSFNATKDRWEINDVMPPDEYQEHARNSIFTNLVANYAVNTARWLACLASADYESLIPNEWLDKMEFLAFPYNQDNKYHEEYEGFQQDLSSIDDFKVKQADVVLLNYPLGWTMPKEVLKNDLEIYESITDPFGPAMTWSMFAINWMDLNQFDQAEIMFNKSYQSYIREPFKVWTEVAYPGVGAVNFITGIGGFLQALIYGYGGVHVTPSYMEIKLRSRLPSGSKGLKLQGLQYMQTQFDLHVSETSIEIKCRNDHELNMTKFLTNGIESGMTICIWNDQVITVDKSEVERLILEAKNSSLPDCQPPADKIKVDY